MPDRPPTFRVGRVRAEQVVPVERHRRERAVGQPDNSGGNLPLDLVLAAGHRDLGRSRGPDPASAHRAHLVRVEDLDGSQQHLGTHRDRGVVGCRALKVGLQRVLVVAVGEQVGDDADHGALGRVSGHRRADDDVHAGLGVHDEAELSHSSSRGGWQVDDAKGLF